MSSAESHFSMVTDQPCVHSRLFDEGVCADCGIDTSTFWAKPYKSNIIDPLPKAEPADNNGGSTDYYKFDPSWVECADVIEARGMDYNLGNIFKSAFCFNTGRHSGTDPVRELNKIIYFAKRELALLEQSND